MAPYLALGIVVVAIALFSIERIPTEVSSLVLVVLLAASGLLTPKEALAGFSSDTVIFIFALLAMTQGLATTGVMERIGSWIARLVPFGPRATVAGLLLMVCAMSSIASNTAVTAAFLPIAVSICDRTHLRKREVLMPLAFASMLGGTIFLFGSSTNLVVSAEMEKLGLARIGFAELTPVGLVLASVGLLVTVFGARKLLAREAPPAETLELDARSYLTEAIVPPGSRWVGKTLAELEIALGVRISGCLRDEKLARSTPDAVLRAGDRLVIVASRGDVIRLQTKSGLDLRTGMQLEGQRGPVLAEIAVLPTSLLAGRTLRELRLEQRGVAVLALHRHPALQRAFGPGLSELGASGSLETRVIAIGDVLLVSATKESLGALRDEAKVTLLGGVEFRPVRQRRAWLAVAIFAASLLVAARGPLAPSIAGLCGLVAMIVTGCVDVRTAFRVDWRVVLLIGSLLALGLSMEKSGAGTLLAHGLVPLAHLAGPRGVLALLMALTVALSVPMSNQAAALVMLPVALHAGSQLGLEPRTFAMGICLAASCSMATPLEPSAALVFGPGEYRFGDFVRIGGPLTLLLLVLLTALVPLVWPFVSASAGR